MATKHKLIRVTTIPASIGTLLRGQLAYMTSDYEVVAVSSSDPPGTLERIAATQGIRSIPVQMTRKITPLQDLKAVYQLYRILRREKPYFVHTHTPKAGLVGMMAAFLARVPLRMHDIAGLPLLVATGNRRRLLIAVERFTYALATHVYPNSHRLKEIATELKLAPSKKLKVLGNGSSNGVNTAHFDPAKLDAQELETLRKSLGFLPGDMVSVFIGRLVGDKGINEMIAAFTPLAAKHQNMKLLLIGHLEPDLDPLQPETEAAIHNHPQIKFVGGQKDVRPFLAISDLLVFPTYREGFPNVPMEAGSMGLPSIVTDINGCNEIIQDGENGVIIPPQQTKPLFEAWDRLLTDHQYRTKLASAARPMVQQRYEQQKVWVDILEEYRRLETDAATKL